MPGTSDLSFPALSRDSPRPWEHRRWRDPSPPPRPSSRPSTPDPEVRRVRSRSFRSSSRPPSPVPTILDLHDDRAPTHPGEDFALVDRPPARGRPLVTASTPGSRSTSPDRHYSLGGFAPGRAFGNAVNDRRNSGKCWEFVEVPNEDGKPTLRRACAGCPSCLRPAPYPRGLNESKRSRSAASVRGAARSSRMPSEKTAHAHSPLASSDLDLENTPTRSPGLGAVRDRIVAVFRERSRSTSVAGA